MTFLLTCIGGVIMMIALLVGIFFTIYLFAHAHLLFPFRNGYQEGEAEIIRFTKTASSDDSSLTGPTRNPVLKYYNAYQQKTMEQELWNSGILSPDDKYALQREKQRVAEVGTKVAVQYTKKAVRVADERYVLHKKYDLMCYMTPIIICLVCGGIGAMMLVIGIVLS